MVVPVAEGVDEEPPHEFGVGEEVQENDEQVASDVDAAHHDDADLVEGGPVDAGRVEA